MVDKHPWGTVGVNTADLRSVRFSPNSGEFDDTRGPLLVDGGGRLSGTVVTSGFKHALVTVTAAAALGGGTVRIANCPDITETRVLCRLLTELGGLAEYTAGTLTVNAAALRGSRLDPDTASRIHGAVYLLPALLARAGTVRMPAAGGCRIGTGPGGRRPVEQYMGVLKRFGADSRVMPDGALDVTAPRLTGCTLDLLDYTADRRLRTGPLYSGATKMALLTAAAAHGTSVLRHPYPKPDVTALVTALRGLGADIEEPAADMLVVHGRGVAALDQDTEHTLVPDLIEVVTWLCAGVLYARDRLRVTGPNMAGALTALAPELRVLEQMGVRPEPESDAVTVRAAERLRPTDVLVASHGVFSDSQPFLALLAAHAEGTSTLTETVWGNRFGYLSDLNALGTRMSRSGQVLTVEGPHRPRHVGRRLHAGDLRAAAVLLLAALAVPGRTVVDGTHHLSRGYRDLPGDLNALGATITTADRR